MQADGPESGEESAAEDSSRKGKHDSDGLPESELGGQEVQNLEQDKPEKVDDELSKEREPAKEAQVLEEEKYSREKSLERNSKPVKDEEEKSESEEEKDLSVKSEKSDEEEQESQSLKEPVDHVHIQQESVEEKPVAESEKCGLEHETEKKEKKPRPVIKWANIRPCLASIEDMMCTRVKNVKYMKNTSVGEDHASSSIKQSLSSIGESDEQKSGENDENESETSTVRCDSTKEDNEAQSSVSPEPFFPWYEELEVLVRLGVPKDLRGEVK